MKVIVNENTCIGCGACSAMCPDVFEFNDDGIMSVKENVSYDEFSEDIMDAKDGCPVGAIEIED